MSSSLFKLVAVFLFLSILIPSSSHSYFASATDDRGDKDIPENLRPVDELLPEYEQANDSENPGPEYLPPDRPISCYAQSDQGFVFSSWGYHPSFTQQTAQNRCYGAGSSICFSLGCRWYQDPGPIN